MQAQEIVDKVWTRLNDGTGRAGKMVPYVGISGKPYEIFECFYRDTDTGNKCAVGIFIPDNHPAGSYVGDVHDLFGEYEHDKVLTPLWDHVELLQEMQAVHDGDENWSEYDGKKLSEHGKNHFESICTKYGLKFPG